LFIGYIHIFIVSYQSPVDKMKQHCSWKQQSGR